jgi:hypothetical protein
MTTECQTEKIASQGDEITFKGLILIVLRWYSYLLSKWVIILMFGVIGGVLGFLYANLKGTIYTATTTFVLEDDKANGGGIGSLAGLASMAGVDIGSGGGGVFQGDNIIELYKSRTMIEKTLLSRVEYKGKKQLLVDCYVDQHNLREKWTKNQNLYKIQFIPDNKRHSQIIQRLQDSVLKVIVNDINKNYLNVFKPDKKLNIIKAEVRAQNEFFAKTFNNEIVKNVNDFYVQTKSKKSIENVAILQQKTDSVRAIMNGAIYTAAAVADATPNLNPSRQVQRMAPIQRSQFSAETNKSILGILVQNLELSKIALRKEIPLIQIIDEPKLPLDKEDVDEIICFILGFTISVLFGALLLLVRYFFKKLMAPNKF